MKCLNETFKLARIGVNNNNDKIKLNLAKK